MAAAQPAPAGDAAAVDVLAGVDLKAIALDRAIARGKHLTQSRYVCIECHGKDFSGGTMIDDGVVGHIFGPNLTGGKGSRQGTYTIADWDRSVRHGVRPDGTPAMMPADDFKAMSDHELSDIIAYIRSLPKVDKQMPPLDFGPLLTVLTATKEMPLSAEFLPHDTAHIKDPPRSSETLAFGKHLAQVCAGCHNPDFTGGPIAGAPPDWAPAGNLTQKGAGGWKYEAFEKLLRTGVKPDGTSVKVPMTIGVSATRLMKEEEVKALYAYFSSLPPKEAKP
jgi:mono/diheme cytochrome c family protein